MLKDGENNSGVAVKNRAGMAVEYSRVWYHDPDSPLLPRPSYLPQLYLTYFHCSKQQERMNLTRSMAGYVLGYYCTPMAWAYHPSVTCTSRAPKRDAHLHHPPEPRRAVWGLGRCTASLRGGEKPGPGKQ